jgi:hypothetical protein
MLLTREQSYRLESIQKLAFSITFGLSLRVIYLDSYEANDFVTLAEQHKLFV